MALYRFLFAPVLLAIAVLTGARDPAAARPPDAPAADVRAAAPAHGAVVSTSARAAPAHSVR